MAVISVVKLTELEGAKRIDAEFYQPDYLKFNENLLKVSHVTLGKLCEKIHRNPMCYGFEYVASGIPFFRIDDLYNPFIEISNVVFISEDTHQKFFSTALKSGDILMGVRGNTIGRLGVYKGENYHANISPNLIFFRLFNPEIANYIATVLLSKVGQKQIKRILAGTGQPTITSDLIRGIKIPIIEDIISIVHAFVADAFMEFEKARSLYAQAENILLEELGLKDFKPKYELFYTANLSKAFGVHRVDADYFHPVYERIIHYLKTKFKLERLSHLAIKLEIKINPDYQQIYKYIEISDIRTDIGEVTYTERLGSELPPNARIPINGGELLTSKVRPTRKAIAIVPSDLKNNVICSSAFTVFDVPSPLREYIFISLRSIIGLLQLEQPTTGTEYPTIRDDDVKNILVPVLPKETQQKIASLVQQSHEARKKAKELLEEAKRKVEEAIETEIKNSGDSNKK